MIFKNYRFLLEISLSLEITFFTLISFHYLKARLQKLSKTEKINN
jgi:hypothetical protein